MNEVGWWGIPAIPVVCDSHLWHDDICDQDWCEDVNWPETPAVNLLG